MKNSVKGLIGTTLIAAAATGATAIYVNKVGRKPLNHEYEIEDLDEAKKLIFNVYAYAEELGRTMLRGEIDVNELSEATDTGIYNLSNGKLKNKEEFRIFTETYYSLFKNMGQ